MAGEDNLGEFIYPSRSTLTWFTPHFVRKNFCKRLMHPLVPTLTQPFPLTIWPTSNFSRTTEQRTLQPIISNVSATDLRTAPCLYCNSNIIFCNTWLPYSDLCEQILDHLRLGAEHFVCVHKHAHARVVWGYTPPGKFCKLNALRLLLRPLLAQSGTTDTIVICTSLHVWL